MYINRLSGVAALAAVTFAVLFGVVLVSNSVQAQVVPTCNISVNPSNVSYSGSSYNPVTVTWNSSNATSANLTNVGSVSTNGSQVFYPSSTTTYILNVYNAAGTSAQCQTTVTVTGSTSGTPSCTIYANPTNVNSGGSTTLTWNSTNATSANLSNQGSVSTSGSQVVYPSGAMTYTLTVYNAQGQSAICTTGVTTGGYGVAPSCWINLSSQNQYNNQYNYNQSATLSWGSTNASSATISPSVGSVGTSGSQTVYPSGNQLYTMTVYNSQGQSATCQTSQYNYPYGGGTSCSIYASPSTVQSGQSTYLTWTSSGNVTSAWLSDGLGNVAANGSRVVNPTTSRTYTLTVSGPNGTQTCNAYVTVGGGYYGGYPYISLNQIPYTGFEAGTFGNIIYFAALALFALAAGYLVVFYLPKMVRQLSKIR